LQKKSETARNDYHLEGDALYRPWHALRVRYSRAGDPRRPASRARRQLGRGCRPVCDSAQWHAPCQGGWWIVRRSLV